VISCASAPFSDVAIGCPDAWSSLPRSGVSLDEPLEAATANADLFAALLEVCASVSRNDCPVAFVAAAWFEAVLLFTGLSEIRTPCSLHVAGQRSAKTNFDFIARKWLFLFALKRSRRLRRVAPGSKLGNACRS